MNAGTWRTLAYIVAAAWAGLVLARPVSAAGGDWPQWLGPDRSCVVPAGSLPAAWPAGGPKLLWKVPCGQGCSTPVVSAGRVVVMDRVGDTERIVCLSARDGKELWKVRYAETFKAPGGRWGHGARSTPATDGKEVYCLGVGGQLSAVELATGKVRWRRPLLAARSNLKYGAYANVLLAGELLIVMKAYSPAVLALEKRTGKTVWTALGTGQYLGSPVCTRLAGRQQLVAAVQKYIAGLDPKTGKLLWKHTHPKPVDAFFTPAVHRDVVYFNGYGIPGYAFKVIAEGAGFRTVELWRSGQVRTWFNGAAARNGRLYVAAQAYKQPYLFCCDVTSGKVLWRFRIPGLGTKVASWVIVSGERLLVMVEDGRVILGRDAGDAFEELGRTRILSKTAFAMPAVVDGRLYARDFHNVVCLDLESGAGGRRKQ